MLGVTVALKITIGVLGMVILSSTTPFPRLLLGFEKLRTPRLIVVIVSFMWRYLHVLGEQVSSMQTARAARGYSARYFWQAAASTGALVATLFVRSLERGERVYLAMLSRGYSGTMPATAVEPLALRRVDLLFLAALARRARVSSGSCCHDRRRHRAVSGAGAGRRALRLPGRPRGAARDHPARGGRRTGRGARTERRGQVHAVPAPQRHPRARRRVGPGGWPARGQGEPQGDQASGWRGVPGPGRHALHADGGAGHRLRAVEPGALPKTRSGRGSSERSGRCGCRAWAGGRRTTSRSDSERGWRPRRC